jgi:hypothetical protein
MNDVGRICRGFDVAYLSYTIPAIIQIAMMMWKDKRHLCIIIPCH